MHQEIQAQRHPFPKYRHIALRIQHGTSSFSDCKPLFLSYHIISSQLSKYSPKESTRPIPHSSNPPHPHPLILHAHALHIPQPTKRIRYQPLLTLQHILRRIRDIQLTMRENHTSTALPTPSSRVRVHVKIEAECLWQGRKMLMLFSGGDGNCQN